MPVIIINSLLFIYFLCNCSCWRVHSNSHCYEVVVIFVTVLVVDVDFVKGVVTVIVVVVFAIVVAIVAIVFVDVVSCIRGCNCCCAYLRSATYLSWLLGGASQIQAGCTSDMTSVLRMLSNLDFLRGCCCVGALAPVLVGHNNMCLCLCVAFVALGLV